jgi:hypothetical protein
MPELVLDFRGGRHGVSDLVADEVSETPAKAVYGDLHSTL